jgi:hypothetical protein
LQVEGDFVLADSQNPVAYPGETASPRVSDVSISLNRIAEIADGLSAERLAGDARALAERLIEGRFYAACIGQFKRGKSTLIGALIGDPILPAGVVPVTTVPTVIRFGKTRSARVRFRSGTWTEINPHDLHVYVSEEHNPENTKGVEGVEVFVPSALLATGMCFVDTPGIGSIFAGNTAATRAFVPHIDAAIVVVGADPPLAGEELALVEAVGKQVRDLLVVFNKSDRTTDAEREAAQAFTRKVLENRLGRVIGVIYEVSALERLESRGSPRDWGRLVDSLQTLVARSGREIVRAVGERGLRRLTKETLLIISEEREALLSPIEEYERRISAMQDTIRDSHRSLQDLSFLFMAEQHRLSDLFLTRRKDFLRATLAQATSEFNEGLKKINAAYGPSFRRKAMRLAQEVAERHVLPWLGTEQESAEKEYKEVASRFVGLANDFLERLSKSGFPELSRIPNALHTEKGFRVRSRFSFEQFISVAMPASPLRYLADVFLGLAGAHRSIERAAREFLEHLLETNSTRVQSDVVDRVQESRNQLEAEIRKLLLEVGHIAQRALEHARTAKAAGAAAVASRLTQLTRWQDDMKTLLPGRA